MFKRTVNLIMCCLCLGWMGISYAQQVWFKCPDSIDCVTSPCTPTTNVPNSIWRYSVPKPQAKVYQPLASVQIPTTGVSYAFCNYEPGPDGNPQMVVTSNINLEPADPSQFPSQGGFLTCNSNGNSQNCLMKGKS